MYLIQASTQKPALETGHENALMSALRRAAPLSLAAALAACSGAPELSSESFDEGTAESALITSGPSTNVTVIAGSVSGGSSSAVDEHCAAPQSVLDTLGIQLNWQMRVQESTTNYTICTVTQVTTDGTIRMTATGMLERLGLTVASFPATLYRAVPNPDPALKNDYAAQQTQGELVEQRIDGGSNRLISTAPHGGKIDATNTHLQAERVRTYLSGIAAPIPTVTWTATGWRNPGNTDPDVVNHEIWHITSTEINENSFTELLPVISRGFDYAVSFHSISDSTAQSGGSCPKPLPVGTKCYAIWVGGGAAGSGNDAIKTAIVNQIKSDLGAAGLPASSFSVTLPPAGAGNGGTANSNIVNRLARDRWGVQLEQTPNMLKDYWSQVADAVAKVYAVQPDR
jgi:phage replication-related protein YjqB (UPF0714/DUF867 family)